MGKISRSTYCSVIYHDIFDYPLNKSDTERWYTSMKTQKLIKKKNDVTKKDKFFLVKGKEENVKKRIRRERISARKLKVAFKLLDNLHIFPTIQFVGITGALAMRNANEDSDIDALIITKKNCMWITRGIVLLYLMIKRVSVRRFGEKEPQNKLCLNIWIDEDNLAWPNDRRNIFTAHEILQIIPVFEKDSTHRRFLWINRWVQDYWPKAIIISKPLTYSEDKNIIDIVFIILEPIAMLSQVFYMRRKRTRELIEKGRAFFHPNDWSKIVMDKLTSS